MCDMHECIRMYVNELECWPHEMKFDCMMSLRNALHGFAKTVILFICFEQMTKCLAVASKHYK